MKKAHTCPACGGAFVEWDGETWVYSICPNCPHRNPPIIKKSDLKEYVAYAPPTDGEKP